MLPAEMFRTFRWPIGILVISTISSFQIKHLHFLTLTEMLSPCQLASQPINDPTQRSEDYNLLVLSTFITK